ncbi:uncharacterized protein LOC117336804 [Pecten maximus]|uniref:uncharacterized protein LOC117336804 n=1 Tax=Pecten maximus TaxID=6579 RepID=UPI001458A9D3|nr:uncharacterized protein LOC117336804 [Pecten maximus]
MSAVSMAVVLLMAFMVGYKMLPSSTWLPSSTSQYQENNEISTTLFLESPVTTEIPPLKGYIIYDCDDQHTGPCGGWSERMAGIFSSYVISVLLRKHFLIRYTRSFNLTDYLIPSTFDWKYNSSILPGRSWDYQDFFSKTPNALKKNSIKSLGDLFPYDVNFVRMSWDYTEYFRHFQILPNVIPWVLELHFADIYLKFFNTLFQPTKFISQTVNRVVRNVTKLACAHISLGGRRTISEDDAFIYKEQLDPIWNLLRAMEKRNYSLFIATDSQFVRNTAKTRFKHLLEVEGRILQMDRPIGGDGVAGGYKKVVADFLVLTKCDVLILTKSGFGILAAYMNNKTKEMYCLNSDEVLPCSRYTIHSFYPEKIFYPLQ